MRTIAGLAACAITWSAIVGALDDLLGTRELSVTGFAGMAGMAFVGCCLIALTRRRRPDGRG